MSKKLARKRYLLTVCIVCLVLWMFGLWQNHRSDRDSTVIRSALDDPAVYNDKTGRYKTMGILTHSYLDFDFYGAYLLPANAKVLGEGIPIPSVQPTREPEKWGGSQANGRFTWDSRWPATMQFKIWWERVVNPPQPSGTYDKYTEKRSAPGTVWCESLLTIYGPAPRDPRYLILHFYPDGHIEGEITKAGDLNSQAPRFIASNPPSLPSLRDRPCIKEIPNPYFGTARPIQIN